jgi:hypothetical protein
MPPGGDDRLHLGSTHLNPVAGAGQQACRYVEHVARSFLSYWRRYMTGSDPVRLVYAVRLLVLVGVLVTVPLAKPHLGAGDRGAAVAVVLGIVAATWIFWQVFERSVRCMIAALSLLGVAGGVLAGLSPLSPAIAVGCVVTAAAGVRLSTELSLGITAATVAAFLATGIATGVPDETLVGYPFAWIACGRLVSRGTPICSGPSRPSEPWRRPAGHARRKHMRPRSPNEPGSPGRSTTFWPTRSPLCR